MKIVIAHLYYDLLNLCGEVGNVKVLKKILEENGIDVEVRLLTIDDELCFDCYDVVYIGHGIYENLLLALNHLRSYKDDIRDYIDKGKVFISTGNSYEVFGNKIDNFNGLGIFDFKSFTLDDRKVMEVTGSSSCVASRIIGFMNTSSYNDNQSNCFLISDNGSEGILYKNFIGTYTLGPLLVRNSSLLIYVCNNIVKLCDEGIVLDKALSFSVEAYDDCIDRRGLN